MVMSKDMAALPRPRLEARRQAFLDAASAAFLEKGYAGTTLDDVICRSGGSRQTLYALFGGKQGLFEALVTERCAHLFGVWPHDAGLLERPPESVLLDIGTRYLQAVTTPEALGVYRLVVAEGLFMRDLAERFWALGPACNRAILADYLARQAERGTLRIPDPDAAAHQFAGMLLGHFHMQCLLGLRPAPGAEEISDYVRSSVALFLDGCRGG